MEKQEKIVLIDGNSLINRAFYALPLLKNSSGEYSNAVYGFCKILIKIIEEEAPKYVAVAFDMGHPTFRHQMFDGYKAGRKKMPDELASQLPILKAVLDCMHVKFVEQPGIEADDLIGTLSKKFDIQTTIVSGDRDLFQLVDDSTNVWFTKKGITDVVKVTPQSIQEVYGVSASQVVDLKSLMGDSSDNISGVAGIGEKTAKSLLEQFGSLDNIYANIESIPAKVATKLSNGRDSAMLSRQLATIKTDVDLSLTLHDLEYDFPFNKSVYDIFNQYEFWSILKQSELFDNREVNIQKKTVKINYANSLSDVEALAQNLATTDGFAFYMDQSQVHIANSKYEENIINLVPSIPLCPSDALTAGNVLAILSKVLQNSATKKYVISAKNLMHVLKPYGIDIAGVTLDANLALYLLSGSRKTDCDAKTFAERFGYDPNVVAVSLFAEQGNLLAEIKAENMEKLYFDVELPLAPVLFAMEQNGFKIDTQKLDELSEEYSAELDVLTKQIYEDAGEQFNIKSPKQLSVILFDKLGITLPRNSKKSTGIEVLEKIEGQHPIVSKILRYRKIEKLQSTYVEPFKKMIDPSTHLIHTIFNQTLTSTGRLSSSEPNLQNIPIRDDEGKNLRKMFVSRFDGGQIITSDYSQIELRLIAHYSSDPKLQYAYHHNVDIHALTASEIFGVPLDKVTPKMRRDAKAVNFGIIYGISDFGLAQNIHCSRKEAKDFIDAYFDTYKSVKQYMDGCVESAKKDGFVSTLFGRKRKIDEINSTNYVTRQFGERASMNMPLQGTASDIIKIAMVNTYREMKRQNLKSKLILQIHDELIVDATPDEVDIVKDILKQQMEGAVTLSVPLTVDVESGANWFEAK